VRFKRSTPSHKSTKDKLKFLKDVLSGGDIEQYLPNRTFTALTYDEKEYSVREIISSVKTETVMMSAEEYKQFCSTLREYDTVFCTIFSNYSGVNHDLPITDGDDLAPNACERQLEPIKEYVSTSVRNERKAEETPLKPDTEETQLFALPVRKTSGKLSDYGVTWGPIKRDIYYS
jgi:hypothetical protein